MGLMCSCDDEWEPGMTIWFSPKDYTTLATKRSRTCCSCGNKIVVGATCAEVRRGKVPETEMEERIYGDDDATVPMASKYQCERCADLAFSLDELGYCAQPWEDQRELVREYAELRDTRTAATPPAARPL